MCPFTPDISRLEGRSYKFTTSVFRNS